MRKFWAFVLGVRPGTTTLRLTTNGHPYDRINTEATVPVPASIEKLLAFLRTTILTELSPAILPALISLLAIIVR
jgi:hypothetical protein